MAAKSDAEDCRAPQVPKPPLTEDIGAAPAVPKASVVAEEQILQTSSAAAETQMDTEKKQEADPTSTKTQTEFKAVETDTKKIGEIIVNNFRNFLEKTKNELRPIKERLLEDLGRFWKAVNTPIGFQQETETKNVEIPEPATPKPITQKVHDPEESLFSIMTEDCGCPAAMPAILEEEGVENPEAGITVEELTELALRTPNPDVAPDAEPDEQKKSPLFAAIRRYSKRVGELPVDVYGKMIPIVEGMDRLARNMAKTAVKVSKRVKEELEAEIE